jgi:hydrogenase maturation protease
MDILVLGIGQSMRGDDAAGLEVVRQWQARYPGSADRVKVEFSELPGLALLDSLAGMNAAILVDAVHSSASVGTVLRLGPDELASFTPETAPSHGWGLAETLHFGFSIYPWLGKCRITLIGIVGRDFGLGAGIGSEVAIAILKAGEMVETEIQALNNK